MRQPLTPVIHFGCPNSFVGIMLDRYEGGPQTMIILETERLVLRQFELDDAPVVFEINSDPEVVRYAEGVTPSSLEESIGHLRDGPLSDYAEFGYGRWALVLKPSNELIGFCGMKFIKELGLNEIGYRMARKNWGQGIATEAATATLEYARQELGMDYVIALIMEENVASIRVAEKLGMQSGGLIRFDGIDCLKYETHLQTRHDSD
jgi:RimJ/RimL family protein N-acetyltransferase